MILRNFFTEAPYAAALCNDHLSICCSSCFGVAGQIWKCVCQQVTYCSPECKEADRLWHENECFAFQFNRRPKNESIDMEIRLLGRLLTRQRVDEGVTTLTSSGFPSHLVKDRCLDDLMSHERDFAKRKSHQKYAERVAAVFLDFFKNTPLETTKLEVIRRWYHISSINGFSITCVIKPGHPDYMPYVGEAIYLNVSRFNHSCNPGLVFGFAGSRIVIKYVDSDSDFDNGNFDRRKVITKKEFKNLTLNYGYGTSWNYETSFAMTSQRIASLKSRYFFRCRCDLCRDRLIDRWQTDASTIECPRCSKPYVWKISSPRSEKAKLTKTCRCPKQGPISDKKHWCNDVEVRRFVKALSDQWKGIMKTTVIVEDTDTIIKACEPVRQLAARYWNPSYNVRLGQLCENIFEAYWQKLSNFSKSADSNTTSSFEEILNSALDVGEMMLESYARYWEPYNIAMAVLCHRLASLYRLRKDSVGVERASHYYLIAARIWKLYGDGQCQKYYEDLSHRVLAAAAAAGEQERKAYKTELGSFLCTYNKDKD